MLVPLNEDDYPGFAVASFHQAAWAEAEVSSDLYDPFLFGEVMAAFIIGDASGKGLEAAACTAQIKPARPRSRTCCGRTCAPQRTRTPPGRWPA